MTDKIADELPDARTSLARALGRGCEWAVDGVLTQLAFDGLAIVKADALDAKDKRIAELEAALERADEVIGPFAKEADQWDASVSDAYRPGVTEPGHSQAHANAEFRIGDLRAALAWKEGEALMALPSPPSRLLNKEDRNG